MTIHPVVHPFPPVWNAESRILILGSFPSVRSRETGFYYGHPQNRFWPLMARLYGAENIPQTTAERSVFALRHGFALWDAIGSCSITGSSDASIRNATPNDIAALISQSGITRIFCNGQRSYQVFSRYCTASCPIGATPLPSTSAANAAWNLERLAEAWKIIL